MPFPFEAALSGIRELPARGYAWYRRNITVPRAALAAGGRVLLKFEAVDWFTEVFVAGRWVGAVPRAPRECTWPATPSPCHRGFLPGSSATTVHSTTTQDMSAELVPTFVRIRFE